MIYTIAKPQYVLLLGIKALVPVRITESSKLEKLFKVLKPTVVYLAWLKCEKMILPGMSLKKQHVLHFDKRY